MSQAREELITIETVREDNKECAYAVVDENKRKSKCYQGGPSSPKVVEVQPFSKDEHIAADQSALKENEKNDQEEKRHHVYANVDSSTVAGDPVEHFNHSFLEQGKEINSIETTSEQDPNSGTERNDHFYAVVDKSKKKRMAPKVSNFKPLQCKFLSIALLIFVNDHMFNTTFFKDC